MEVSGIGAITDRKLWDRGIAYLRRRDRKLALILTKESYHDVKLDGDYYGALVESIVYQQIAGNAAESIMKKFKGLYKGRIPKPSEFLSTEEHLVKRSGISPQKYSYIKDLSERLEKGLVELEKLNSLPDAKVIEKLDAVNGIGRWTAEMFLIFSLGRTDVLPMDDLGIRKAVKSAYNLRELPDAKKLTRLSKNWHPYCTIATLCLWRSHDVVTQGKK